MFVEWMKAISFDTFSLIYLLFIGFSLIFHPHLSFLSLYSVSWADLIHVQSFPFWKSGDAELWLDLFILREILNNYTVSGFLFAFPLSYSK